MGRITAWPSLHARDARKLISFYEEAFGFVVSVVIGEGERVDHAELLWGDDGGLMVGSAKASPSPSDFALAPGTFGAYFVTDSPQKLFERAVSHGATIVTPPEETPFGSVQFCLRDLEGNLFSFGTYAGYATSESFG